MTAVIGHDKGGEAQLELGVRWWWQGSLATDEEDGETAGRTEETQLEAASAFSGLLYAS
jgi:hypothetical protein